MMLLVMPWPARELHPNARVHWHVLARKKALQRETWALLARDQGAGRLDAQSLTITVQGLAPDARRRDVDGLLASCKAGLDGLADVLGIDDSRWSYVLPPIRKGAGIVQITVEAADA